MGDQRVDKEIVALNIDNNAAQNIESGDNKRPDPNRSKVLTKPIDKGQGKKEQKEHGQDKKDNGNQEKRSQFRYFRG